MRAKGIERGVGLGKWFRDQLSANLPPVLVGLALGDVLNCCILCVSGSGYISNSFNSCLLHMLCFFRFPVLSVVAFACAVLCGEV